MAGTDHDDISWFGEGLVDRTEVIDRLHRYLRSGSVRPEWCFLATTPAGNVGARHWWWAAPGLAHPAGVDLVSVEDRDSAINLLRHARDELQLSDATCELATPVQPPDGYSAARGDWGDVLTASGFALEVSRVRVEWTAERGVPSVSERLMFRPTRALDDERLLRLFESVADGSLDHWMAADRAEHGREQEARQRLAAARSFYQEADWLTVGFTHDGVPVGYAVPAVVDEVAVIAEIGVAPEHRGNRYGLELLRHATRTLIDAGAPRIVADTDQANTAIRAAFAEAGFVEREYRESHYWHRQHPG
jgi:ribosomal protein S18 acetylase RimI-like enzyme